MYLNFYCYLLFLPLVLITSILSLMINSWFTLWMLMEINLISFIMFIIFEKFIKFEMIMNYFLIQCLSSYIYLFTFINLEMNNYMNIIMILIMMLSMLMKMGMPPFYQWYMYMMKNLNWISLLLMSTIQKIIPLVILNSLINLNNLIMIKLNMLILVVYSLICSIMNLNNLNIKLIMGFSSIIQMSWMINLMIFNEMMMINYFIIYNLIMINLCFMLYMFNINNMNQLNFLKFNNKMYYIMMMCMLLSIAGIPPMFGFLMKWLSIQSMSNYIFMNLIMLIFSSIISMFFYIRMMFNSMSLMYTNVKVYFKFINYNLYIDLKLIYINLFLIMLILSYELF